MIPERQFRSLLRFILAENFLYPVGRPYITDAACAAVGAVMESGNITQGEVVSKFERRLEKYLNVNHVVACSSGTSALHLALVALGIGPGDEVLVPDVTFVATANAVRYVGAIPVPCDIDPHTWNISLEDAVQRVTRNTKAIIPVHLYGVPCNMDMMKIFAANIGLFIIEDAAEGFGGTWNGHMLGTLGHCGTFSFYGNKIVTTAEGGCVATNSLETANRVRFFRGQAQSPLQRYRHLDIGFNYRMTELSAAIGISQLDALPYMLEERERVMLAYKSELGDVLSITDQSGTAPWLFTGLLPEGSTVVGMKMTLAHHNIETRPIFQPLHSMPMYTGYDFEYPVATFVSAHGISLPTYVGLTSADVAFISQKVREALQ